MENLQFIVALDASARFVHLFLADSIELPIDVETVVGQPLGTYIDNEAESKTLRSTFAECLFTGKPQECVVHHDQAGSFRFRFEKITHRGAMALRSEDEIVVIGVITQLPKGIQLTKREQQIVRLICKDLSSAAIAKELKVKTSTIETHRQNIRQKLGVRGNAGVVLYAVRNGLLA